MGKKNRNKRNRLEKQRIDSNPGSRWSTAILDVIKELNLKLQRSEDRISSMHDDILSHIISFLPFKSAVQTSFLSRRWKDVWKKNFRERKGSIDDAFAALSSFLLEKPTSNWGFIFNLNKRSFISVATNPDHKAIQLDFSNVKHVFPRRFDWTPNNNRLPFESNTHYFNRLEASSFSFEITSLHLKSVSYIFSRAISSMIINFKFLKNLTIEKCHGLQSLRLEDYPRPRVKKLTILDCEQLESLHLDHLLESLRFRGKLLSFQGLYTPHGLKEFWFNGFHLDDAMFDFRQGNPHCMGSRGLLSFLRYCKDVKSLTLSAFQPALIFPMIQTHFVFWKFKFCRLKELCWIDYSKERFDSNALICILSICPRLSRLYITIDPKSYRRTRNYSVDTSLSRLKDLEFVKLEGFGSEKEEIILAKRLKQEFNAEPLIIAKSNYLNCARLMVKAEPQKEGEDSFMFIEARVEHLYEFIPKHLHMLI